MATKGSTTREPIFFKRPKKGQSDAEITDDMVGSMFEAVNKERKKKGLPALVQPKKKAS
jgi:uncharacterized protein YkwD